MLSATIEKLFWPNGNKTYAEAVVDLMTAMRSFIARLGEHATKVDRIGNSVTRYIFSDGSVLLRVDDRWEVGCADSFRAKAAVDQVVNT